MSDSSSTAYLANSGPFLVSGHGRPQQRLHHQQQRYLPPVETVQEPNRRQSGPQKGYGSSFADPSEPIYTDPSLFERYLFYKPIPNQFRY